MVAMGIGAASLPAISDFLSRALSHRERTRVEQLVEAAGVTYKRMISDGLTLRQDGFFDANPVTGRSSNDETVEAVLTVAKNAYEERKLPFMAHLLAVLPFDEALTPGVANWCIGLAEQLSWTHYVLLAAIERHEKVSIPQVEIGKPNSFEGWAIHSQAWELRERSLITSKPKDGWGTKIPNHDLPDQRLTKGGRLLFNVLGLEEVGSLDVAGILLRVVQDDRSEEHRRRDEESGR